MSLLGTLAVCLITGCGAPGETAPADTIGEAAAAETIGERALTHRDCDHGNPALFAKDARPYGVEMEAWAERWWKWSYSIPAATNPNDVPDADCDQAQQGPVFFLRGGAPGRRDSVSSCTIKRHRAVAVSLSSIINDYPCPDPTFQPAAGQTLFDFLAAGAKQANDDVASIDVSLDGHALTDLLSYRVASDDLMYFTGDPSLQKYDSCITGTRQPAVVDSYFILFKPLAPGVHVLTTKIVTKAGVITSGTKYLDVRAD